MAEFKLLDEASFKRGVNRKRRRPLPRAISARFDRRSHRVIVRLDTGLDFSFDPRRAQGLAEAPAEDFVGVTVEGVGSTLHFPRLDADYAVSGLLEGFLGPLDWTRREAQAKASRENGKRGGRPKKEIGATT
ncbi:DUF2442 domain-containing protein [Phenylobacterium sp.]|uniref:DUF2442 domain-containing protein n=1 Tax=Phenylobacterium sp. TaxID=1871053 RepID=UPI0026213AC9|nr:DUF2442 domain-containing protein [Phenylobacterium sp.]